MECGGVEDEAKWPEVPHQLRVDPELEEEDELGVDEELRGRDEERGREVEPVGQLEQPLHRRVHCALTLQVILMSHWTWNTGCLKAVVRLNSSLLW